MNDRFKDIKPGEPGNAGRDTYKVDYPILDGLCEIQCTGEECAAVLKVDYETLNTALKRDGHGGFVAYRENGPGSTGKVSLRRHQFKAAYEDGNTAMLIWLGKQYLGQLDKQDVTNHAKVSFSDALMGALKDGQQPSNQDSAEEID